MLTLNLHMYEGTVRVGDGPGHAIHTQQDIPTFIDSEGLRNADQVHVAGMRANAALIAELYHQQQCGNIGTVRVATPLICETAKSRDKPETVLFRLIDFSRTPSLGGFHTVTDDDYRAYALAAAIMDTSGNKPISGVILRLLHAHPAWKALTFIPSIDPVACASLLGYILDPRWYIDQTKPNKLSKLEAACGLHPKTQVGVTINGHPRWKHHIQCQTVLSCWKQPTLESRVRNSFNMGTPTPIKGSTEPGHAPGDFPWRVWGRRSGIGLPNAASDPVVADLRASQRFLAFLRHTWLGALYENTASHPEGGASLFYPEAFFRHDIEIAAFVAHRIMQKTK